MVVHVISPRIIKAYGYLPILGVNRRCRIYVVHAPSSNADMGEMQSFRDALHTAAGAEKHNYVDVYLGDFNARVGSQPVDHVVGICGAEQENANGTWLREFCQDHALAITNTMFEGQSKTWCQPDGKAWWRLDYVCISKAFLHAVLHAEAKRDVDIRTTERFDHVPVVCELQALADQQRNCRRSFSAALPIDPRKLLDPTCGQISVSNTDASTDLCMSLRQRSPSSSGVEG